jgi:phosphate transport system substrate-binding protein
MSGAYALYPMAVKWGEEFKKLHPGVTFDIQGGGAGKGMTDALSGTVSFGMVSRDIAPEEIKKGAYAVGVCEDAVIPTINSNNPFLATIQQKGITKQQFYKVFISGEITTWGQLLGVKSNKAIKLFTRSDASGAGESWAKYLGYKQEDLLGTGVFGDPDSHRPFRKIRMLLVSTTSTSCTIIKRVSHNRTGTVCYGLEWKRFRRCK